ncbi:MAG: Wzt carbohydrate-binding domain-containing protein, partial [Desulfuromonadaceae bacterium]|nr:Wzt carbohydrate-binding domain-containing protein [Desulfuromonadaceae bacterium]
IELGAGFNPVLTGRENVYVNGSVLGFSKDEIDRKLDEIIAFAELNEFIDAPVQSYSSGMRVRLGFAIAAQMEPDILIIDEVLAVGDMGFRSKCYAKLTELIEKSAVIFVSHQMYFVNRLCSSAILLKSGQKICIGSPAKTIAEYNKLFSHESKVVSGDQETFVQNLILLDQNKRVTDTFGWCDSLNAELDLFVSRKYEEVALSVTFMGMDGATVAQCHSSFNEFTVHNTYTRNRVRLEIDRLNLNPGAYYFNLIVYDKTNNRQLLWLYATKKFEVTGEFCGGAALQYSGRWHVGDGGQQ